MVALTGTNFIAGGTTVNVSGTGVTVTVVAVNDNTSLGTARRNTSRAASFVNTNTLMTANFVIDAAAAPGARNVTVTTAGGTSNSLSFTVSAPGAGGADADERLAESRHPGRHGGGDADGDQFRRRRHDGERQLAAA